MLGNWAAQTTTTASSGNLTLAAITGQPTIEQSVGLFVRFWYSIVDDTTGLPIEGGIGYLSNSTTMVREKAFATYAAATYDNTSPAFVTLSAGTKRVIVTPLAGASVAALPAIGNIVAGAKYLSNGAAFGEVAANAYNDQDLAGRMNVYPWRHDYGGEIDAFVINCTTAGGAGAILRVGLYATKSDGTPGELLCESPAMDVSTTGVKIGTFTARALPPGWYYVGLLSNSASSQYVGTSAPASISMAGPAPWGSDVNFAAAGSYVLSLATSAMPNPCPSVTTTGGLNVPHLLIRAV